MPGQQERGGWHSTLTDITRRHEFSGVLSSHSICCASWGFDAWLPPPSIVDSRLVCSPLPPCIDLGVLYRHASSARSLSRHLVVFSLENGLWLRLFYYLYVHSIVPDIITTFHHRHDDRHHSSRFFCPCFKSRAQGARRDCFFQTGLVVVMVEFFFFLAMAPFPLLFSAFVHWSIIVRSSRYRATWYRHMYLWRRTRISLEQRAK